MSKYTFTFQDFTDVGKELLSEQTTLEVSILDMYLDNKPTKEQKEKLKNPQEWAKYAFESPEHLMYCVTAFKDGIPIATINNYLKGISVKFLDKDEKGELVGYMRMIYWRYVADLYLKKDIMEYYPNNQLFLKQIDFMIDNSLEKSKNMALFNDVKKELFLRSSIFDKKEQIYRREEKTTKVNISHNFVRSPKHYLDYEYLLDYKNILKPEFLDIIEPQEEILSKPDPYKIHEGKEYTQEEWKQYQEEKRKNARPGTTWSLLDD